MTLYKSQYYIYIFIYLFVYYFSIKQYLLLCICNQMCMHLSSLLNNLRGRTWGVHLVLQCSTHSDKYLLNESISGCEREHFSQLLMVGIGKRAAINRG